MQRDDKELEKYLSEFRPRPVRPLNVSRSATAGWIGRLAAAALVLLSVGGGLWHSRHTARAPRAPVEAQRVRIDIRLEERRPNTIALTKLALENENQFEAQLDAESRTVLPDFQGQQGTLRVFAKE